jgi:hypothetical protein
MGGNSHGSGGCWETTSSRNMAPLSTRQLNPTFGSSSEPGGQRRGWTLCLPGRGELWSRRLPRLTSSAHGKNSTPQSLRTQQPPCAESAAAGPEERLTSLMTIKALILRANNALFPRSPKSASTRFREQNGATRDPLNCRDICSIRRFVYFECCFYCECPICFSWRSKTHGDTT